MSQDPGGTEASLQQRLLSRTNEASSRLEQSAQTGPRRLLRSLSSPACNEDVSCPRGVAKSGDFLPFAPKGETSAILMWALLVLLVYLAAGIALFYFISSHLQGHKTWTLVDALYFCIVTMTTVGYGDLVPATAAAKLLTCVYLFLGFGLVGVLLSSAANYLVIKQEELFLTALSRKDNVSQQQQEIGETGLLEAYWKVVLTGVFVLAVIVSGVVVLMTVESKGLLDAIYFVSVTVTTLGYGDHTFQTGPGRLFGSIWILVSTLFVAQFFLALAEMRTQARQQRLAKWVVTRQTTISDLEAADADKDGRVR